jgi:hypothetical protein
MRTDTCEGPSGPARRATCGRISEQHDHTSHVDNAAGKRSGKRDRKRERPVRCASLRRRSWRRPEQNERKRQGGEGEGERERKQSGKVEKWKKWKSKLEV